MASAPAAHGARANTGELVQHLMDLEYPLTTMERLRLCERVTEDLTGCWSWLGTRCSKGYGVFSLRSRQWKAHRIMFALEHGRMPVKDLDHLCRNRFCVRPDHLEEVDVVTNVMRGESPHARNARKTQCPRGHPYARLKSGFRYCPICNRESSYRSHLHRSK